MWFIFFSFVSIHIPFFLLIHLFLHNLQIPQLDWESSGLIPSVINYGIQFPEIECPLRSEELNELKAAVDPMHFGADVYIATLHYMHVIGYM